MIKHRNNPVLAYKRPRMQKNVLKKRLTIVSDVSSLVGNPVYLKGSTALYVRRIIYLRKLKGNCTFHKKGGFWHVLEISLWYFAWSLELESICWVKNQNGKSNSPQTPQTCSQLSNIFLKNFVLWFMWETWNESKFVRLKWF